MSSTEGSERPVSPELEQFATSYAAEMNFLFGFEDFETIDPDHRRLINDFTSSPIILDPYHLNVSERQFIDLSAEEMAVIGKIIDKTLKPDRSKNLGDEKERIYKLGKNIPTTYLHEYAEENGSVRRWLLGPEEPFGELPDELDWSDK